MINDSTAFNYRETLHDDLKKLRNRTDTNFFRKTGRELAKTLLSKNQKTDIYKVSKLIHQNDVGLKKIKKREETSMEKLQIERNAIEQERIKKGREVDALKEMEKELTEKVLKLTQEELSLKKGQSQTNISAIGLEKKEDKGLDFFRNLANDSDGDIENMLKDIEKVIKEEEGVIDDLKNFRSRIMKEIGSRELQKQIEPQDISSYPYENFKNQVDEKFQGLCQNIEIVRNGGFRGDFKKTEFLKGILVACKKMDTQTVEKIMCIREAVLHLKHRDGTNSAILLTHLNVLDNNPDYIGMTKIIRRKGGELMLLVNKLIVSYYNPSLVYLDNIKKAIVSLKKGNSL